MQPESKRYKVTKIQIVTVQTSTLDILGKKYHLKKSNTNRKFSKNSAVGSTITCEYCHVANISS